MFLGETPLIALNDDYQVKKIGNILFVFFCRSSETFFCPFNWNLSLGKTILASRLSPFFTLEQIIEINKKIPFYLVEVNLSDYKNA